MSQMELVYIAFSRLSSIIMMERVKIAFDHLAAIIVQRHLIRSRRCLQMFVWPHIKGETEESYSARFGLNTERVGLIWARRDTKCCNIWELWNALGNGIIAPIDGKPRPLAYIQIFTNGQTAYWFRAQDKGIEGKSYGNKQPDITKALMETMEIVERRLQ